ncbi:MAG: nitroreductase family protein [Eubacterium sp.]|nr:nitroreductase family protein [Eubacterium sp.]
MKEIFKRISVRKYTDQAVEPEKIKAILKAAMQAPSAGDQQPWEFYVVTDPGTIARLAKASPYGGCTANAKTVIVPCYRTEGIWFPEYAQIDLSIACENLWLETTSQGLGTVMLGIAPLEDRMTAVEGILNLPASLKPFAIFPIGYPAESRDQNNRFDEARIHYV